MLASGMPREEWTVGIARVGGCGASLEAGLLELEMTRRESGVNVARSHAELQ